MCDAIYFCCNNAKKKYKWDYSKINNVEVKCDGEEHDLGIVIDSNLTFFNRTIHFIKQADFLFGLFKRSFIDKNMWNSIYAQVSTLDWKVVWPSKSTAVYLVCARMHEFV